MITSIIIAIIISAIAASIWYLYNPYSKISEEIAALTARAWAAKTEEDIAKVFSDLKVVDAKNQHRSLRTDIIVVAVILTTKLDAMK